MKIIRVIVPIHPKFVDEVNSLVTRVGWSFINRAQLRKRFRGIVIHFCLHSRLAFSVFTSSIWMSNHKTRERKGHLWGPPVLHLRYSVLPVYFHGVIKNQTVRLGAYISFHRPYIRKTHGVYSIGHTVVYLSKSTITGRCTIRILHCILYARYPF